MARRQNMIAHVKYHYEKEQGDITIRMDIDLSRFNKQYGLAQFLLDSQVMTDMVRFMPHQSGVFVNVTKGLSAAIAESGKVYAAAPPMGRFLYEGKTMVDELTGSPWARKGARKVLVSQYNGRTNASPELTYSNGDATPHWFETAKQHYGNKWIAKTKRTAGGG